MVAMQQVNRARTAVPTTLPSPVGGLNARDGLAQMPPLDAFLLDNFFPASTTVDTRNGSKDHKTGLGGPVETLIPFYGNNVQKLLAFGNGSVFDATNAGAAGAPIKNGLLSTIVCSTMFSNPAGTQFLIGCTGLDTPFGYDGTTYTDLALTGITGDLKLIHCVHTFKGRLYFAKHDQLGFYYLPPGSIQGAAQYFDLAQQSRDGGTLLAIASFSEGSGSGPNDYIVFMTSTGEYIMYAGSDPSSVAGWQLVGRYYGGPPIGRFGWFNFRSDLYIITEEGVCSFTQIRQQGRGIATEGTQGQEQSQFEYLSAKLGRAWTDLTKSYSNTHGWGAAVYPRGGQLVVNVPTTIGENGKYYQFVMNTNTNAWCRFKEWNGISWTVFDHRLYFGTYDGKVLLADEGGTDNGVEIRCDSRQAYNYFDDGRGMGDADKHFHWATFIVVSDGTPPLSAGLCVNFQDTQPDPAGTVVAPEGAIWDVAAWDSEYWAGEGVTQNFTISLGNIGYAASMWLRTSNVGAPLKWYATRMVYDRTNSIVLL